MLYILYSCNGAQRKGSSQCLECEIQTKAARRHTHGLLRPDKPQSQSSLSPSRHVFSLSERAVGPKSLPCHTPRMLVIFLIYSACQSVSLARRASWCRVDEFEHPKRCKTSCRVRSRNKMRVERAWWEMTSMFLGN